MYLITPKIFVQIFCCHQPEFKYIYIFFRFTWQQKPFKQRKTLENDTVDESDFNIKNMVDQKEAINKIKYKVIRYESIQGQMMKKKLNIAKDLLKTLELVNHQFILKLVFVNF